MTDDKEMARLRLIGFVGQALFIAPESPRLCRVARSGKWSDVSANHGNKMGMR